MSITEEWERQLEEEQKRQDEETVEKVFDGMRCKARKLSILTLATAGVLPEFYVERLFGAAEEESETTPNRQGEISAAEQAEYVAVRRRVVCQVIAEPRLVLDGEDPGKDGVSLTRVALLKKNFIKEVWEWVLSGCPVDKVKMKGGEEVAHEDLARFPKGGRGKQRPRPRNNGKNVRTTTV